ncbi:MAG: hypothetical protein IIW46_06780, partial [Bacteroidaceae bacterium]|nr:hypothetical protein [Bacteroidaceae bacterium]
MNQKKHIKLIISKEKRIFASWKGVLWPINVLSVDGEPLPERLISRTIHLSTIQTIYYGKEIQQNPCHLR